MNTTTNVACLCVLSIVSLCGCGDGATMKNISLSWTRGSGLVDTGTWQWVKPGENDVNGTFNAEYLRRP